MEKQDAEKLAAEIREQFAHVETLVVEQADKRPAPYTWFIAVTRKGDLEGESLFIHSRYEWSEALTALHVLQK